MKVATNIILIAIALYLSVEILSRIDKARVDTIKNTFAIEQVTGKNYTLIPKRYGFDTIKVFGVHEVQTLEVEGMYNTVNYWLFITNNKIIKTVNMEDYELQ